MISLMEPLTKNLEIGFIVDGMATTVRDSCVSLQKDSFLEQKRS